MDNPAVSVSDTPAKAFPSSSGEMFDQYFTQGSKCSFKKNELLDPRARRLFETTALACSVDAYPFQIPLEGRPGPMVTADGHQMLMLSSYDYLGLIGHPRVQQAATSTSRSAVSRRFVAATETALAQLLAADLSTLDLVGLMIDGVHFGEHCCVVALGIGIDGTKHPLSLVEGSTENATLVTELIVGLRERGLDVTRPILVVLDGSKALRRAVLDVFDRPVLARCQLHKIRNVQDKLPQKMRQVVAARMRRAYHADSALAAEAELTALANELDRTHPGAAASLREGMAETLTVLRLGLPPTLARTFRSTNAVESMISICRDHAGNVKRWRDGQMALRWCAAGMVEAGKQFRRVNGHLHLRSLRDTLERVTQPVGATRHHGNVQAA